MHRDGNIAHVAPQTFDLLEYLIKNRGQIVSKDELVRAIWGGRAVSDAAITTRLNVARRAIGDTGGEQRLIKTIPRKGFRFVGQVQETRKSPENGSASDVPGPRKAPRLSMVILPFLNIGGQVEQEYFAEGIMESLTTDLSRIPGLVVIARGTAFTFKGKVADAKQVGRELNVRYVLDGSVQRNKNRVRISVQLSDAESGAQVWAERFDKVIADLFVVQDEIVSRLARSLDPQLIVAEARRAHSSLNPNAMDLYFQGMASIFVGPATENLERARAFFEQALSLDPQSVDALVGMAYVTVTIGADLLTEHRSELMSVAEANAIRALSLAPEHAGAHLVLGYIYIFTNRAAIGISECERALALNRNLAGAHSAIGLAKMYLGRHPSEVEEHIAEAFRLSPVDVSSYWWMYCLGMAKLQLGEDASAVAWFRKSIETNRNYPIAHFALAAVLGLMGELDDARATAKMGLALNPGFTIERWRAAKPTNDPNYLALRGRLYTGLQLASVPEK
nr:winged helix-turn-helix domain-containing protein [Bradyrhizobium zhengyangense]